MCVETEVSGCLDYIEPLQPSVILWCYTLVPSGFSQGDDKRALIHSQVGRDPAESSLHPFALAQSCWDFSLWWSMGMERREKSKLQEHCCCRQLICDLMSLTEGCISEVMISHSNNKLKEFMTLGTEFKISWWKICLPFLVLNLRWPFEIKRYC